MPKSHLSAWRKSSFLPVSHYLQKPQHAIADAGSAGDNKLCSDMSMAQEKEKKRNTAVFKHEMKEPSRSQSWGKGPDPIGVVTNKLFL